MNLSTLSDSQLLLQTKSLVAEAREVLTRILFHLREVERRRLYCDLGYSSLMAYAVDELKYSEAEAIRRISAMRLLRDVPEVEQKINTGIISLTSLAMAQNMFSKEKKAGRVKSAQQKIEILQKLEHKTTRQVQKILSDESLLMATKRPLDLNDIVNDHVRAKVLRLQGLLAHSYPGISLEQLLGLLCDGEIERQVQKRTGADKETWSKAESKGTTAKIAKVLPLSNSGIAKNKGRKIPVAQKVAGEKSEVLRPKVSQAKSYRQIWLRDHQCCSNCGGTYALQIDHIIPKAMNGPSIIDNLRLLCRTCNQRAAIKNLGMGMMTGYFLN